MCAATVHPFRILALDGGGIKGTFTPLSSLHGSERFDFIERGSSQSGWAGLAGGELLQFYREQGPCIFPRYPNRLFRKNDTNECVTAVKENSESSRIMKLRHDGGFSFFAQTTDGMR